MLKKILFSGMLMTAVLGLALSGVWAQPSVLAANRALMVTPTPLVAGRFGPQTTASAVNQGEMQQLTSDRTASFRPAWSPDGRRIAFHRRIGGWKHIFTMKADGSDLRQLTTGETANFDPAWSRDNRIAFVCNRKQSEQICVINADGSGFTQLTSGDGGNGKPAWSPDGRSLIFGRLCSIYRMDANGTNVVQLVRGSQSRCSGWPAWSPDGTKIAFRHGSASGGAIYVVDTNGNVQQITDASSNNRKPAWSPDGRQIVFERAGQILVANIDGTGITVLTPVGSTGNRHPDWSPNGDKIAFERATGIDAQYGDELYQIYVISVISMKAR